MLKYIGDHYVEGTRAEVLDLKNGTNTTGSNPDLRTLVPGMCVKVSDAKGGAALMTAVAPNQFALQVAQEGEGSPWKTANYNIDTDSQVVPAASPVGP